MSLREFEETNNNQRYQQIIELEERRSQEEVAQIERTLKACIVLIKEGSYYIEWQSPNGLFLEIKEPHRIMKEGEGTHITLPFRDQS